jgi:glycosyltransferase involved in cell wall biosynthesis
MIAAPVPHAGGLHLGAVAGLAHAAVLGARLLGTRRLDVAPRGAGSSGGPLRILYVWDDEYPWDVRTEKICRTLTSAGHEVHIVARNAERRPVREILPEGTVHRMRPWPFLGLTLDRLLAFPAFFSPRWVMLLSDTAKRVRPDLVIVRDLPLAPTAIWLGRRLGIPVTIDMAENYPAMLRTTWAARRQRPLDFLVRNPLLAGIVERYALAHADRVLVVVDESEKRLRSMGIDGARIDVVGNTPPLAQVQRHGRRAAKAPGAPLELVYLGYLELPRGITELLGAAARLRQAGHAVTVTLIGDGRDTDILGEQARLMGLGADVVRFRGYLPHAEALAAVADADVGIVPHRSSEYWDTTIPNKLFDYMAAGLPVVTSDAVPSARVVREAGCGEIHRGGDAGSLAAAVARLLDAGSRARLGERGRHAVLRRYNWERDAGVLLDSVGRATEERAYALQ